MEAGLALGVRSDWVPGVRMDSGRCFRVMSREADEVDQELFGGCLKILIFGEVGKERKSLLASSPSIFSSSLGVSYIYPLMTFDANRPVPISQD